MLFIGFAAPHFPLIAPQPFVDPYPPAAMPLLRPANGYVRHHWLAAQESFMPTDVEFAADDYKRRRAISAYYALCAMMDACRRDLAALEDTGARRHHGDLHHRSRRGGSASPPTGSNRTSTASARKCRSSSPGPPLRPGPHVKSHRPRAAVPRRVHSG
jgi:hypothetical protein